MQSYCLSMLAEASALKSRVEGTFIQAVMLFICFFICQLYMITCNYHRVSQWVDKNQIQWKRFFRNYFSLQLNRSMNQCFIIYIIASQVFGDGAYFELIIDISMQSWEKTISAQLNRLKPSRHAIPSQGINNCIILETNGVKTYTYFAFTDNSGYIDISLVTLAHHQGNKAQIHRCSLNSENGYRQKSTGIRQIQVVISRNASLPYYLILFTYRLKDSWHSQLSLLELNQESIISEEFNEMTLMDISVGGKRALKAEWHPHYHEYFLVLTTEDLRVYSTKNDNDSQLDLPCFTYTFRDLQISQPIVDFQFWRSSGEYSRLLLVVQTEINSIFMLLCVLQPQSLNEEEQQFLYRINKVSNQKKNPHGFMSNWLSLPHSTIRNGRSIKVIKAGACTLLVKTSDVNEDTKTTFLQISSLEESQLQFTERQLLCLRDEKVRKEQPHFQIQDQLIDNALYFLYRNRLIRLDLDSPLKYINHIGKHKNYGLPAFNVDTLLDFKQERLVFLQFDCNYIRLLRKTHSVSEFNSFPLLSIELQCSRKEIDQKLAKLFSNMEELINHAQKEYKPVIDQRIGSLADFKAQSTEKEVNESCSATESYIGKVQQCIRESKDQLQLLFEEVSMLSRNFDSKNKRKSELQTLLKSISNNSKRIDQLLSERGGQQGQDKTEYLENMIDFISTKKSALERDDEEQFMAAAQAQLEALQNTKQTLKECEERLADA